MPNSRASYSPSSSIGFRSLQEAIATTTSGGKLVFQIFGALAEFERNLIRKRNELAQRATPNLAIPPAVLQYSQPV